MAVRVRGGRTPPQALQERSAPPSWAQFCALPTPHFWPLWFSPPGCNIWAVSGAQPGEGWQSVHSLQLTGRPRETQLALTAFSMDGFKKICFCLAGEGKMLWCLAVPCWPAKPRRVCRCPLAALPPCSPSPPQSRASPIPSLLVTSFGYLYFSLHEAARLSRCQAANCPSLPAGSFICPLPCEEIAEFLGVSFFQTPNLKAMTALQSDGG